MCKYFSNDTLKGKRYMMEHRIANYGTDNACEPKTENFTSIC